MKFWRLVIADRSSGGVLAVLVGVLLVLQGLVNAVATGPAAASPYRTFIHCITGRADEAGNRSGPLLLHGSSFQANQPENPVAIVPDRIVLILPAHLDGIPSGTRITALLLPRRPRLISEPRAPPTTV